MILLVGGIGKLASVYRAAAASLGADLVHAETRLPSSPPRVDAALICVSVCSHSLREAAQRLAEAQGAAVVYLRQPSISCVRRALAELLGTAARRSA